MRRLFEEKLSAVKNGLTWKRVIGILLTALIFSFLGVRAFQGIQDLRQSNLEFVPEYLVVSFFCQIIGVLLAAAVWSNILNHLRVPTPYSFDLEVYCASSVAQKIPGTIWYAVGRISIYSLKGIAKTPIIIGLAIEAIVLALGGAITLSYSLGTGMLKVEWIRPELIWIFVPVCILAVSIFGPKIIQFAIQRTQKQNIDEDYEQNTQVKSLDVLRWIIGEAGVAILAAGVAYFILKAIIPDNSVPYVATLGAFSLSMVIGPIAMWLPGDIGIRDGFMYLALSAWIDPSYAAVVVLAWRAWLSLLVIIFGLIAGIALSRQISLKKGINND